MAQVSVSMAGWRLLLPIQLLQLLLLLLVISPTEAAYVQFSNCLNSSTINSNHPKLLQMVPLNVTASFDTMASTHNLEVTFYVNVTGQYTTGDYPPSTDPSWEDPESQFGKIVDQLDSASLATTLFSSINVLSYTPYRADALRFCNETLNQECPLIPSFNVSRYDLNALPAWNVSHNMGSAYAFTEIVVSTRVQSGASTAEDYVCINAYLTPDLGQSLRDLLRYLPVAVLVCMAIATIAAAIFSPWGTWDIFRWTSNFGRDEDVLRLVTPGFGDCLQYIQFIVLTGSLSLNYPGFYQPVVSQAGWSVLLFNESFVTHGPGMNPVVDGLYQYRDAASGGLDRMTQLIGMTAPADAWAAMMVWLVVIVVATVVLTQLGFALRWVYRLLRNIPPEDLRSKNWYFTVGNVIRITMGYFLLPVVTISMFQFVIAGRSPIYTTVLAAVVIFGIIIFSIRLVYMFARTRPRSYLFDDLQCVLAYGSLYNTYCDDAATFAFVPILVNFLRGVAIGAVQASGVAQIVILAISEIVFLLTINAFRPFPAATSMNLYHTCFSIIRLVTVLMFVAFVPTLGVSGASRGWIAYVILLIHACILVFGFFLNAVQTLIEVVARLAGAGGSGITNAARGGLTKVFGVRQLSKRLPRTNTPSRNSMSSNAAMLHATHEHRDSMAMKTRSRSVSASSTMLLENNMRSPARDSQMYAGNSDGQITPDASSTFSMGMGHRYQRSAGSGIINLPRQVEAKDPYYRPPRRNTADLLHMESHFAQPHSNVGRVGTPRDVVDDRGEGSSTPYKAEDFEDPANELTKTKTDYAVREVDFYYGVRGPALSSGTRKLKTGPADPTGPVSNATGWFKGLLGGRQKEKTKGFEVVRSARAPPPGLMPPAEFDPDPESNEPYRDSPAKGSSGANKNAHGQRAVPQKHPALEETSGRPESAFTARTALPVLPLIDTGGDIELPSRVNSEYTRSRAAQREPVVLGASEPPSIPRRSSRRTSSADSSQLSTTGAGNTIARLPFAPTESTEAAAGINALTDELNVEDVGDRPKRSIVISNHAREDRPNSVGYVKEHRASDGIIVQADPAANITGTSGEIHNNRNDNGLNQK